MRHVETARVTVDRQVIPTRVTPDRDFTERPVLRRLVRRLRRVRAQSNTRQQHTQHTRLHPHTTLLDSRNSQLTAGTISGRGPLYRQANTGSTSRFRIVEDSKPPSTVMAIGASIS